MAARQDHSDTPHRQARGTEAADAALQNVERRAGGAARRRTRRRIGRRHSRGTSARTAAADARVASTALAVATTSTPWCICTDQGIVTLALVSHFWPLPEPARSLEMLQRHEAKRSEFGGELCQRDNADRPSPRSRSRPAVACRALGDPRRPTGHRWRRFVVSSRLGGSARSRDCQY